MRRRMWLAVSAAALVALAAISASAGTQESAEACFTKLKSLAGDWYVADPQSGKEMVALRYKVTAGGSALEETEMPGTGQEMITMYHMDGASLVLTHYCHVGNQPHMKATAASTPRKIVFQCAGVGNAKSEKDMHMHALTITPVDDQHLQADWQLSQDGKPGEVAKFLVHRKGAK